MTDTKNTTLKTVYAFSLIVAAVALLAFGGIAHAAKTTDERIVSSAQQSYVFKTYLKGEKINIASKNGAVILTGTVGEEFHKNLAQETVASLPGVKSVDNKLVVVETLSTVNEDAWLKGKVKVTLLFHRSVSAGSTEVDVVSGVVTLRGVAESQAQKELTTEYVRDVEGVKDVKNEMSVTNTATTGQTAGEEIDDASTTAQVKMALLFHRSTSALSTTVETQNGVVTVSGKAKNVAEKDLVTKLVNDVNGVKSVKNRMTIE